MNSNVKLKVMVEGITKQRCNQFYNSGHRSIIDSQICAGKELGKDSCDGMILCV